MNILHITANPQEAEIVERQLTLAVPGLRLELAPTVKDAAALLGNYGAYDAILADMNLPGGDAESILAYVRQKSLPLAIIAMISPGDEDPPMEFLKAGADDYVVKRNDYVSLLPEILQRTIERRQIQRSPIRLLYAGNIERARHELAAERWLQLDAAIVDTDGSLKDQNGTILDLQRYGAIILEESYLGAHILRVLRNVVTRVREIPALLLIEPGHEEVGVQGLNLGAADYIVKSGIHLLSLTTKLRASLAHRELARRMPMLESSEARLRMIVEAVPVSLLMLARDGVVLAMNMSGISLVGATRAEDIVARSLFNLLPTTESELLKSYIEQVCRGERGTLQFNWEGLDGKPRRLEMNGVPIQRGPKGDIGVLGVLTDITQAGQLQQVLAEAEARLVQLQREVQQAEVPARELVQKMQFEGEHWEAARRELEERAKKAEDQREQIEETLRAAGLRQSELVGKYVREHAEGEAARQELEQKARDAEEQRVKLEEMLQQLNSSKSELAEKYASEKTQWEVDHQELEQRVRDAEDQRVKLEENLQQLNSGKYELAEEYGSEKAQWEAVRQELEQKVRDAEEQRVKLEEMLQQLNSSKSELAEKYASEKTQWEVDHQELEQRVRDAEDQRVKLEENLQLFSSNQTELAEKYGSEKIQWEAARQELEQKIRDAEDQRVKLEENLQLFSSNQTELAEKYGSEKIQWEAARQELEQKVRDGEDQRVKLEENLQLFSSNQTELAEKYRSEKTQWEVDHQELEQRIRDAEDQRAKLEETLQQLNSSKSELAEEYGSEKTQWEAVRQELEQKANDAEEQRTQFEEMLQLANSRQSELAEKHANEKSQWGVARQELELRAKDAEEQRLKLEQTLQLANSSQSVLAKKYANEKAQWETGLQELDQKVKGAEGQRIQFEEMLQLANSSQSELTEKHASEKSQWEATLQELDQKVKGAEDQRIQFEEMLQLANSSQSELAEKHASEKSQWETALQELEQKVKGAEDQRIQFEEMLQLANSSQSELAEKHASEKAQWGVVRQELELRAKDAEEQRSRIEEVLRTANSRQSELAELHAREQTQWEAVRQELEKGLKNMAGLRAELAQALQVSETQKAELAEKCSQAQEQLESVEKKLEQQIILNRLLEARESALVKEHEERRSSMETSCNELEQKLEELQSKSASLEEALQNAQKRQEELIEERRSEQDKWNVERLELEQQAKALANALQELEIDNAKMAASIRDDLHQEPSNDFQGKAEEAGTWNLPAEVQLSHLSRVHRLIDDTENRYQLFVKHQSDSYQKLLSEAMQRAQRDTEEWKRILSAQNAGEREFLELMLHKAESRIQRLEEQFKKEREQLELKLHAEEERRRRLSEFCSLGLSASTVEGRILDCNDTFAQIFGYQSADEILAQPEDEPLKSLAVQETLDGRLQAQGETPRVERCARRKDGQPVWLLENVALIPREGEGEPVVERGVIDVTERQQLFAEIRRARRIEAIVQLSATAVREFNTLLDSMMEISNIALLALNEHDPRRERAEQIHEMAGRASSLAQELSAVIQKQEPKPELLEVSETVNELESMLRLLAGDDVELIVKPGTDIGVAAIERSRFEQALTALVVAARDSLPAGGTVSIELSRGAADQKVTPFPYMLVAVRALGYGVLPPQISSNLNGLVTSCKGHLKAGGKSGKEAVFELFIPGA